MPTHARRPLLPWNGTIEPLNTNVSQAGEQPVITSSTVVDEHGSIDRSAAGRRPDRDSEQLPDIPSQTSAVLPAGSQAPESGVSMLDGHRGDRRTPEKVEQEQASGGEAALRPSSSDLTGTNATLSGNALLDPSLTFRLHSDPTATRIIYLDFDGHTTTGTAWNTNSGVASYSSPAYDTDGNPGSFSSTELDQIQQIWQRVAADFAPFAIDVTTQEAPLDWLSRTDSSDTTYGIRVVISDNGPYYGPGGVSYVNSFTWDTDTPAFIYKKTPITVAETISHEVGHTLGLSHDGTTTVGYYSGHGNGEEGWAPIMGASTSQNVTTWDDGTYTGANNGGADANGGRGPDDLYVITNHNGISYRPDTEGGSMASAVPLSLTNGSFGQFGTITTRNDQDFFSFTLTSAGTFSMSADPYWSRALVDADGIWGGAVTEQLGPVSDLDTTTAWVDHGSNLDLSMQLLNSSGAVVASSNPTGLRAGFNGLALTAGSYVVKLDGVGTGNPTATIPTGYSDYASIGNYWLSGNLSVPVQPPTAILPSLSASDASVVEGNSGGNTSFKLNVNLNTVASQDVVLIYATRDGTATSKGRGADFMAISNGQLIIPKGQLSGSISLQISADLRSEPDELFNVDFKSLSGALLERSSTQITILNDDSITGSVSKTTMVRTLGITDQGSLDSTDGLSMLDPVTGIQTMERGIKDYPETTERVFTAANQTTPIQPTHFLPETTSAVLGWAHHNPSFADSDPLQPSQADLMNWLIDNNPRL